ncbi:sugar ABC transporter permease [Candidatus Aerophobetes bacterium]|nr:sugar ABC transporter permease [Candidatus Aerophobetes bacterium]
MLLTIKRIFSNLQKDRYIRYLLILPLVIVLVLIVIYPFIYSIKISFTNAYTSNYLHPKFVGLKNYIWLLRSPKFWNSVKVSLIFVGIAVFLEVLVGLGIALLVNQRLKVKKITISLLLTPMFIASAIVGIIFRLMLNELYGVIPYYLTRLGINQGLLSKRLALFTVILIDVWQWTPFVFLILYAGLQTLPIEPLEAAMVDGASKWQSFRFVVLPLLSPILAIVVVFRMMDAFKAFDKIYVLTAGGPGDTTTTINVFTYFQAYEFDNFGRACATTILFLILITILAKISMSLLYKSKLY